MQSLPQCLLYQNETHSKPLPALKETPLSVFGQLFSGKCVITVTKSTITEKILVLFRVKISMLIKMFTCCLVPMHALYLLDIEV